MTTQYDAAGNLTNDGVLTYRYDATGQQTSASLTGLTQSYDGDGVRVKRVESGATTFYLRSSVLGQQVIAEITSTGQMQRGYVYLGGQLLAVQESGQVSWVHQDPVTKSQRLTDSTGAVVSTIELDPWGGETARSSNQAKQPHRYTSYERDANGGDEAMLRRYESRWSRFSQPDPFDGSYNLTDPQSFNRYSYVQSDPVNFVDPSGLLWRFSQVCSNIDGVIHCDRPELYWEGNPPPGSTGNLDGPPRGGGGGLFDGDPPPAPETPSVPCPPTGNQLATDPNVHQAAFQALLDSRSGSTKAREQGGWLYALNGKIIARRARPGHSSGISIDLTNPPQIRGALLVGTFHTHPSILLDGGYMLAGLPQPSLRDELNAFDRGVPGLTVAVVDGKLKLTPYGPNRRGSNPERAIDPKGQYGGLIRGYPGNAANTTRCS